MLLAIDKHGRAPVYRQIVEQIQHLIVGGHLRRDEQVTSVRELAGTLKVNPMTVSKAYSMLESEGWLERRPGVGLFVSESPGSASAKRTLVEDALREPARIATDLGMGPDEAIDILRRLMAGRGEKK